MRADVRDLAAFYESPLGLMARRTLSLKLRSMWDDVHGLSVLGTGYATPYMRPWLKEAERVLALMPGGQGAQYWPRNAKNLVLLADGEQIPLPDVSIDRVLVIHDIEASSSAHASLREIWRVLKEDGKVMLVVPNRAGVWARVDDTPFGHGHPYSGSQLGVLLLEGMFRVERQEYALFMPPSQKRFVLKSFRAWERIGSIIARNLSGVLIVEASKEVFGAQTLEPIRPHRRAHIIPARQVIEPRQIQNYLDNKKSA